ncbi:MAG: RlmE family RNA methyltransferase [Hyphomicrobiales bacterium]|nr:RlmE family RNA methyltransferase [Rickettsiales bacterium]MCP5362233.1 RlmE family RNA methyltransferase [Hyphomicrobiales bacterium]
MSGKGGDSDKESSAYRGKTVRVRTARKRKPSSTRWLQRQLNDPYVARSKAEGYRSRAAYKLIEINEKNHLLSKGKTVVDLGAAPGSWSQVAIEKGMQVIGIDLLPIEPLPGAIFIQGDFLTDEAEQEIKALTNDGIALVMSDMAASSSGHAQTDHLRIMGLCETALHFALEVLSPGGAFLAKVLQGGTEKALLDTMKQHFKTVKHIKPKASRKDSSEMYVLALGFHS